MNRESHAFIYDDFVSDRPYERQVAEIEARLAALDVSGRIARLALFRNVRDMVESMVSQGVTTIVLFGNDRTLDKVMWFLPDLNVTLGYIPVGEPARVGAMLGIPVGAGACDVLAARLIETIDVGRLDDRYFLTEVSLPNTVAAVDIEGKYRLSPKNGGSIVIRNLGQGTADGASQTDARDGLLDVIVTPLEEQKRGWGKAKASPETRIQIAHGAIISPQSVDVHVDNHIVTGTRFELGVAHRALKVITGRGRRIGGRAPLPTR